MVIVTGTKRSGTSMWMQLLTAAGFPPIGDAFPRNWETTLKDANPGGFWESELRRGIYYETNPDPKTGTYLFPEQTAGHAVKVFVPGLIKTDRAFIGKVIATVRPWRQYLSSVNRLYAIERDAKEAARKDTSNRLPPAVAMSPIIEWWVENFSLISDIVTRRYPFYMVAYDSVLDAPSQTAAMAPRPIAIVATCINEIANQTPICAGLHCRHPGTATAVCSDVGGQGCKGGRWRHDHCPSRPRKAPHAPAGHRCVFRWRITRPVNGCSDSERFKERLAQNAPGGVKSHHRVVRWDARRLFADSEYTKRGEKDDLASVLERISYAVPILSNKSDFSHTLDPQRP